MATKPPIQELRDGEVRVVFRQYRSKLGQLGGDIIALFPDVPADDVGHVMSYQHVGQHGAASYTHVIATTRKVEHNHPDVLALAEELKQIGYTLRGLPPVTWQTLLAAWDSRHMKTQVPLDNLVVNRVYAEPGLDYPYRLLVVHDEWVDVQDIAADCRRSLNRMRWEATMQRGPEGSWLTTSVPPVTAAPSASSSAPKGKSASGPTSRSPSTGRRAAPGAAKART